MKLQNLDFAAVSREYLERLESVREMVLSTCSGTRVTSRVVSTACSGTRIVFLSWGHHTKCVQIRENPNVALCFDNLQIEGVASIKGNPLDEQNAELANLFREKQEAIFQIYPQYKGMQLVLVDIKRITASPHTLFLDRIDFEKAAAYRESMKED